MLRATFCLSKSVANTSGCHGIAIPPPKGTMHQTKQINLGVPDECCRTSSFSRSVTLRDSCYSMVRLNEHVCSAWTCGERTSYSSDLFLKTGLWMFVAVSR